MGWYPYATLRLSLNGLSNGFIWIQLVTLDWHTQINCLHSLQQIHGFRPQLPQIQIQGYLEQVLQHSHG